MVGRDGRLMRTSLKWLIWSICAAGVLGLCVVAMVIGIGMPRLEQSAESVAETRPAPGIEAYTSVGSWVDVFDTKAWRDPSAVVRDMAAHGVKTIYIETATSRSHAAIVNPSAMRTFISEAHARRMYVVAWYPPNMRNGSVDYERAVAAIEFKTKDGQRFDSVALDIESTAVKSISVRNQNIIELSKRIRSRVGTDYPLGAIIPSPVGLQKRTGFWNVFPYTELADTYDVFLPMSYYTFHVRDAAGAYADTNASMRILRAQPGCGSIPVHMIGGIAGKSSASQVRQFARAAGERGCVGASLYDWAGMNDAKWKALGSGWSAGSK
jgi:hypothetical protein